MSKLLYLFLVWTISICILVKYIECQASSFNLKYNFTENQTPIFEGYSVNFTEEKENVTITSDGLIAKKFFLFKIPLKNFCDNSGFRYNTLLEFSKNGAKVKNIKIPEGPNKPPKLENFDKEVKCSLKYCKIGAFYYKTTSPTFDLRNNSDFDGIFYVGYEATEEYKFLFLMYIKKLSDAYSLDIVVCPNEQWISEYSLSKYIVDKNDIIPFPKKNESGQNYYYYKIKSYQDDDSEIFLKCGHINQKFMPPIDVGYIWSSEKGWDFGHSTIPIKYKYDYSGHRYINLKNSLLHAGGENLLDSSVIAYHVLLPYDNSSTTIVGRLKNDSKLYFGQGVFVLVLDDYNKLNEAVNHMKTGYYFRHHPQFLMPKIEATLRLKVSGVVQKFKTSNNSESIDTYTVDLGGMNNGPVGCRAVPDDIKGPMFEDFYERFQTDLFIIDIKTSQYIKVNDTKSLVSNSIYKCVINKKTTYHEDLKESGIKENHFIIHLTGSINSDISDSSKSTDSTKSKSTIWIITGVSVGVLLIITLLLLAGLIFYRKRLVKKKGSKNTLSSGKSSSASKSSNAIKSEYYVAGIQNKAGNAGSKNIMNKKIVSNENPQMSNLNEKRSKEVRSYEIQKK